ncbi:MAG: hypothetical protein JWO10_1279 [Microbacteriaceae bacterium]|nr:hypothetical protein [Microbacteriaceae bacterium]
MANYAFTGADGPIGQLLARDLSGTHTLSSIPDAELGSRAQVETALAGIEAASGLAGVIHTYIPAGAPLKGDIVDMTDEEWDERCELPIRATIALLQGAYTALKDTGGVVVVTTPTLGLSGQKHFAAYAAATEAQRILVKASARSWGKVNIRVHSVVFGPELLGGEVAEVAPQQSLLSPRSLTAHNEDAWARDIASTINFLVSPEAAGLTGTTLAVDSGRWMPL